jgi:hypothetical protein
MATGTPGPTALAVGLLTSCYLHATAVKQLATGGVAVQGRSWPQGEPS